MHTNENISIADPILLARLMGSTLSYKAVKEHFVCLFVFTRFGFVQMAIFDQSTNID